MIIIIIMIIKIIIIDPPAPSRMDVKSDAIKCIVSEFVLHIG